MRRILFIQTPVLEGPSGYYMAERDPLEYGKTWNCNTGDLLVCDSLLKELAYHEWENLMIPLAKTPLPLPEHIDFNRINNEFDACVLRGSNYINDHLDLQPMADFVARLKIPFVPIGLGVQSPDYTGLSISAGTRNFVAALGDACELIGVRGNYSAEQISTFGAKNLEVIGCPSLYRTRRSNIVIQKPKAFEESMSVGVTTNRFLKGAYAGNELQTRETQRALVRAVAARPNSLYISQGETDEFIISRRVEGRYEESLDRVLKYFECEEGSEVARMIVERNEVYFDVGNWAKHVSSLDFIVGLRLHGNIIALQEGVPAVFITYDSRIREICEFMHLPFVDVGHGAARSGDIRRMYELADFTGFQTAYAEHYRTFSRFLERNAFAHHLEAPALPVVGEEMPDDVHTTGVAVAA